jgi:3-oxoacyl-[acyl-carrier protein] reductase
VAEPQRVALVTGARTGIGRHLAEHLVARGYRVVGCSRGAGTLALEGYEHVRADVTDEAQVIALFRRIGRSYGRLDAILNNAGVASMNAALLTPLKTAEAIVRTNFLGTFLVCREGAKLMMKHRTGRIVNFSSIAVALRLEGEALYAAAKSAVETFTRVFAREVAPYGITVNAIGPSPIETDLLRGVPKRKLAALLERLAIRRLGAFADVAHAVDFFLRPESDAVTGQVLYLGGAG